MAFDNAAPSRAAARRAKKELILGVGGHAFVNWPHPTGAAPVMDGGERLLTKQLTDGEEVEIISWRPRSLNGLAYQIRRLSDGSECWILATHLRRQREPQPVPAVVEESEPPPARAAGYRTPRSNR